MPVAIDPRQLRPGELVRLLNSTPLGEVISERQLHRHRTRAGFRVAADGDAGKVDLFRYVAWLVTTRHEALAEAARTPGEGVGLTGYEAMKERARSRAELLSRLGRDVGPLPAVVDPDRKRRASRSFQTFCDVYFPRVFHLPWSTDHLKVIARIERAVLEGGLFAMAMPRGSGKTSLCETACLWALLYGHRDFVALIGSDEEHASSMLESMKAELEANDALAADFPEVCHPIRSLEGIHQRASGQLCGGIPTLIGWTAREIVLPSIQGSPASGGVIRVAGLTGRIRGMKHKRADGASVRPSLVLIDDPQTDESARSPSQCANRERILAGAILGLAGPGRKIAGLMTLTVVHQDDLADRLLDAQRHPHWTGERTKLMYEWPTNTELWDRYAKLRADGLRSDQSFATATEFYRQHRSAMDEGARPAWPARHNHDELSAVQHAMNLRLQDERAFFAEYQNEPIREDAGLASVGITAPQVLDPDRVLPLKRRVCPLWASRVVAMVDVQADALFYLVLAVADDFTACVVDYGTEPEQPVAYFTLRDLPRPLRSSSEVQKSSGLEAELYAGLKRLVRRLEATPYTREDGLELTPERVLIDANWGASTETVYAVCREAGVKGRLVPSHARYVSAAHTPIGQYTRKPGERYGLNWVMPVPQRHRLVRHVTFDANFWKSFVASRFATAAGAAGCLRLFGMGIDGRAADHRMLADHCAAEAPTRVKALNAGGREIDEWRPRGVGLDNHWWDCLVGAFVAASMVGVQLPAQAGEPKRAKVRVSMNQLLERRRARGHL